MTKQLFYDQNSFSQSVLSLLLNFIYSSELQQLISQNLKFVEGQIQIFDYVEIIAKYCSLTKRPSLAGANLREQGKVNMLNGVINDIKKYLKNGQESIVQLQEKLKYFEEFFNKQFPTKWTLSNLTYIDFLIFQISYEIQNFSPQIYKKYTFLKCIRQLILSIPQISQKAEILVKKMNYQNLPQASQASQGSAQLQKIYAITVQKDKEENNQVKQARDDLHEKVGKFKSQLIIQSKENAIEGNIQQQQKIDNSYKKIVQIEDISINAIRQVEQKQFPQQSEKNTSKKVVQLTHNKQNQQQVIIVNQEINQIQKTAEQKVQINTEQQTQIKTEQNTQTKTEQQTQIKTEQKIQSNQHKSIKKTQQNGDVCQIKQELREQQKVEQIKSDKPQSIMLPEFNPNQQKKEQPVKKQAGCTCEIY